ncbi:hypothetical protein ACMD2_26596 [Ananas comosus]|uniref:Uncharacterized protein n=1 Tax=Ananas comosus TaxID=4615 RepID=A0A199UQL5_ANACO|nr:hypothetical protein ACMD2_26596 [Ananas comosus]
MVCQAATQTRFRALKHENGIAGSATIIVRIIACFQPLQDCQAEYFRHLLKPVTLLEKFLWKNICSVVNCFGGFDLKRVYGQGSRSLAPSTPFFSMGIWYFELR